MLDYCTASPADILKKSPLFRRKRKAMTAKYFNIQSKLYYGYQTPYCNTLGVCGDCGNYAAALNRHLCNRGQIVMSVPSKQELESDLCIHVAVKFDNHILDINGVHSPDISDKYATYWVQMAHGKIDGIWKPLREIDIVYQKS